MQLCSKPRGARSESNPRSSEEGVSFYHVLRPLDQLCLSRVSQAWATTLDLQCRGLFAMVATRSTALAYFTSRIWGNWGVGLEGTYEVHGKAMLLGQIRMAIWRAQFQMVFLGRGYFQDLASGCSCNCIANAGMGL